MTPEELWETYQPYRSAESAMSKTVFLAALAEYGKAVRDRDAEIARTVGDFSVYRYGGKVGIAAVEISREPLP